MRTVSVLKLASLLTGATVLGLALSTGESLAQAGTPITHTVFMTGMEVKGATTAEKLAPPAVNPKDLSKGYDFKGPGRLTNRIPRSGRCPATFSPRTSWWCARAIR